MKLDVPLFSFVQRLQLGLQAHVYVSVLLKHNVPH